MEEKLRKIKLYKICVNGVSYKTGNTSNMPTHLFYSASSLKEQSADRQFPLLRNIILILSQPIFALSPY